MARRRIDGWLALAAFSIACGAGHAQDRWEARAPMPSPQFDHGAAAVGGKLHVFGGDVTSIYLSHSHHCYDAATNAWSSRAAMPTWRSSFATAVVNGRIHTIGGQVREQNHRVVGNHETYDPQTDSWTAHAAMPQPRWGAAGVGVGRLAFVLGGQPFSEVATVDVYDSAKDSWSQRTPMPAPRWGHAAVEHDGLIYVSGGRRAGETLAAVDAYDIRSDTWSPRAPMASARWGHVSVVWDGLIYAIGGASGSGSSLQLLASVEVYDPRTDTWSPARPMMRDRGDAAGAVLDGVIHMVGGLTLSPIAPGLPWVPTSQSSHEAFVQPLLRPRSAEDCKDGAWRDYRIFANQGDCVSFAVTGGRNRPGG